MIVKAVIFFFIALSVKAQVLKKSEVISTDLFVAGMKIYNSDESPEVKAQSVQKILETLNENKDYQYKDYWRAVFLTFDSELKDKGRLIPFSIIGRVSEIKDLLHKAHEEYPSYYHYAPARTLGIMYYKMPAIVGGSHKKALKYLQEAYDGAPDFEDNKEWYAKVKAD